MSRLKTIVAFLLIIFIYSFNQKAKSADTEKLKTTTKVVIKNIRKTESKPFKKDIQKISQNIESFVPKNYTILDSTSGDLNLDNYKDMILVLSKNGEEQTSDVVDHPEKRPLLILIGQPNNKYKLVSRNDNTVYCFDCGGIMGDPYTGITIKNGYFSVEHYGGSNWRWTRIITYKYSKKDNNWFLYKDGSESFHVSDPEKITKTILTTKNFGKVPFKIFDIYKDK